jgi:hypothetical protein
MKQIIILIEGVTLMITKFFYDMIPNIRFRERAEYIGTFVITYLSLGGGMVFMLLLIGVNPTLVLSVISAPLWIAIVFLSNKLTKIIVKFKEDKENGES